MRKEIEVIKLTLDELKEKVNGIYIHGNTDLDRVIADLTNLMIDYDNEHRGYIFEDLYNRFMSEEILYDDIVNAPNLSEIGSIIHNVDSLDEYFYLYDETYGWENYTEDDIKEWQNDIINRIEIQNI